MSGFGTARLTSVEQAIRSGRAPDASAIADLAGGVELGADGSAVERQRLRERVLGLGPLASWVARPDVTDVVVRGQVGLFATPSDAHPAARAVADIVIDRRGGAGVLRRLYDLLVPATGTDREDEGPPA